MTKKKPLTKLFYKIGEVAEITGVEPYVLRYWEGEFNLKLTKSKNNQRLYQKKDIEQIQRIKTLLYDERYTIAGAKKKLRERKKETNKSQLNFTLPAVDLEGKKAKEALLQVKKELELFLEKLEDFAPPTL